MIPGGFSGDVYMSMAVGQLTSIRAVSLELVSRLTDLYLYFLNNPGNSL